MNYLYLFGGLVALYYGYSFISSFIANRNHKRRARDWGCEEPFERKDIWPFGLGMAYRLIKADKNQVVPDEIAAIHREQGVNTWLQNYMGFPDLVTVDPKNIQALLATQFHDFEIGSLRRNSFAPLLGNGIFTSDGKNWEHSRALLRPQFARDQVSDLELEEDHVQDMFKHLGATSGWTDKVDLVPMFFRLTLDSATEFLFGQSVDSQLAALPSGYNIPQKKDPSLDWTSFGHSFDSATMSLGQRGRLGGLYYLHSPKSFLDSCKEVHRFSDYYVNLALTTDLSKLKENSLEPGEKKGKYVFLQELVKETRDPLELRSQLLNILLAGRDTTAGLLGWTFYLFARHPAVFEKLRAVILENFGTYSQPHDITFSNLKGCTYLQHVLSETLRMYATVPINSRRATKDTTLPYGGGRDGKSPIYVRKGQEVNYSVHAMHRRKDIWGEDADEFKPERWIGRKAGWEFLPFNGGPRICLGQQFALTEAGYVIVRMLQKFDKIENLETEPVVKHQYSVTTSPVRVLVRLHEVAE